MRFLKTEILDDYEMSKEQREQFIMETSRIPACFLCDLELISNGELLRTYQENAKQKKAEIYSDFIFFYFYLNFFQTSPNTMTFSPDGNAYI